MPGGSNGNVSFDTIVREGRGGRVWDLSGNEYVDYLLGSGPMLIGHAHPEVVSAVTEQVERGTTFFALNDKHFVSDHKGWDGPQKLSAFMSRQLEEPIWSVDFHRAVAVQ